MAGFFQNLFYFYLNVGTYMWVTIAARRGCGIRCSWSYKKLWASRMGWELNVGPLWESQTFLATVPSLQTPLAGCQRKEWKHSSAFLSYSSQGVLAVKTVCHISTHSHLRPTSGRVHPTDITVTRRHNTINSNSAHHGTQTGPRPISPLSKKALGLPYTEPNLIH